MNANEQLRLTLEAEGFITVARAAELLKGVRPQSVYAWVKAGDVKSWWVGHRLFVRRDDVLRMLGIKEAG